MAALEFYSTPLISDASLIAYWRFEGSSAATVGSGLNGTDTGASYNATYGKFNQGVTCGGTSQNNIAYGSKIIPAGAKTITFWYKKQGTTTNSQSIFDTNQQNAANNGTYVISSTDGGTLTWVEGPNLFTINITVPDTNMNLYTLTWDGTTGTNKAVAYINGASSATATSTSATQAAGYRNLNIGGLSGFSYPLKGYLDDVAILSRALTPAEVSKLYSGVWSTSASFLLNFI